MPAGIYKHNPLSDKHKKSISKGMKGKNTWTKGRKLPVERCKQMSDYQKTHDNSGRRRKGDKVSKEICLNISKGHSKERAYNWKKDRTQLKKSEDKRYNTQYTYWSREVKNRDSWKCRLLNSTCKGRLEAHHIFNWIDYPELRYVINNGITLCHFHHPLKWEEEKRMIPIFQELLSVSKE